jgi:integrase/recombinase XerD
LFNFMAWLQEDYWTEPDGVAYRGRFQLSAKSVLNIHTNLSALWKWGVGEYVETNLIRMIKAPAVSDPVIETFTREECEQLLRACDHTKTWKTRLATASKRPTALRDQAIILFLLDTGVRATENCEMKFGDLNLAQKSAKVAGKGPGRDPKERVVYFGNRTYQALWKYLVPKLDHIGPDSPVFTLGPDDGSNELDEPLSRQHLGLLLRRIGDRAGIQHVYPHRFRHTFAVNFIRNGGDAFTLKQLLGHEDFESTLKYVHLAQMDGANGHRRSGPVDHWKL